MHTVAQFLGLKTSRLFWTEITVQFRCGHRARATMSEHAARDESGYRAFLKTQVCERCEGIKSE
jgi:hypothetical protein